MSDSSDKAASKKTRATFGRNLVIGWFVLSMVLAGFFYGVLVGKYRLPPFDTLNAAKDAAHDWYLNWRSNTGLEAPQYADRKFQGTDTLVFGKEGAQPGLTLIPGYFDDGGSGYNGVMVVSETGEVVHGWDVSFSKVYDSDDHVQRFFGHGIRDWDFAAEQAYLYPNGDLLVLSSVGMLARLSWCGDVIWRVSRPFHHGFDIDHEGNIWALAWRVHVDIPEKFRRQYGELREDLLLKISPEGEVMEEISILGAMYDSDFRYGLHQGQEIDFWPSGIANDPLHTNNVNILSPEMAPAFPLFEAGDILISSRSLNMLFLLDGRSHLLKWHQFGPYFRQHDPDFLPDGKIMVFDNNIDSPVGSRILEIDPVTHDTQVRFQSPEGKAGFFSNIRAGSQPLENGNTLISEAQGGRVFEVDASGEMVWLFTNMSDDERTYQLGRARRLSPDAVDLTAMPACVASQ